LRSLPIRAGKHNIGTIRTTTSNKLATCSFDGSRAGREPEHVSCSRPVKRGTRDMEQRNRLNYMQQRRLRSACQNFQDAKVPFGTYCRQRRPSKRWDRECNKASNGATEKMARIAVSPPNISKQSMTPTVQLNHTGIDRCLVCLFTFRQNVDMGNNHHGRTHR